MGLRGTAVVSKGAKQWVFTRVLRGEAAASAGVEVVATVGNGPETTPTGKAFSHDRVLECSRGTPAVVYAAADGGAIAEEGGVAHRKRAIIVEYTTAAAVGDAIAREGGVAHRSCAGIPYAAAGIVVGAIAGEGRVAHRKRAVVVYTAATRAVVGVGHRKVAQGELCAAAYLEYPILIVAAYCDIGATAVDGKPRHVGYV